MPDGIAGAPSRECTSPQRLLGVTHRPQPLALDPAEFRKAPRPSMSALPPSAIYPLETQMSTAKDGGDAGIDGKEGEGRFSEWTQSGTTTGAQLARRVSLSDLKIPTRITSAQQKVGEDLRRIMQFRYGVEGQFRALGEMLNWKG
jgi:hypothetical protein